MDQKAFEFLSATAELAFKKQHALVDLHNMKIKFQKVHFGVGLPERNLLFMIFSFCWRRKSTQFQELFSNQ